MTHDAVVATTSPYTPYSPSTSSGRGARTPGAHPGPVTAPVRISVCIPSFNMGRYVGAAIESALAQSRPPHEVIVVDDCSTDDSLAAIARYPVRLIRHERNLGGALARNTAMHAATGDAMAMLDADDLWDAGHLATVGALLDEHPTAALAASGVRLIGTRAGEMLPSFPPGAPRDVLVEAFTSFLLPHSNALVRRDVLLAVGGYTARRRTADIDLYLRIAELGHRFVCSHAITASYRWHGAQCSSRPDLQWASSYEVRRDFLARARERGSREEVARFERLLREMWERELRGSALDPDDPVRETLLALWRTIPGVTPARAGWLQLRTRARPAAAMAVRRCWKALPAAVRERVKRGVRGGR